MLRVLPDGEAAKNRVAELVAAMLAGRGHDPPHAERRADDFRVARAREPRPDDFLERDDVRLNRGGDGRNAPGRVRRSSPATGGCCR